MKNKKLINLIVPITAAAVATSAIPLTCFALTSNALSKKKDDSSKKEPKFVQLKNSANPKDVDINDTLQPLTFTSDSPTMMWLSISHTIPGEEDFCMQYRIGSVSMPEESGAKWIYDWTPMQYDENINLPVGNDIIIQIRCGFKENTTHVGKLPEEFRLNFNFINAQGSENLHEVNIGGSAMSLLCKYTVDGEGNPENFYGSTEITQENCFQGLFANSTETFSQYNSRLNVMSNFLPFKTLAPGCYNTMFMGSNLVTAPILPSKELKEKCYFGMFANCENLTAAPNLPATDMLRMHAIDCYSNMFYGCKNLKTISIEYVGNFVETFFKGWVTGVNKAGKIYYNGLDTARSDGEIPTNFTVVSDPQESILTYCKDIEIKESSTAKLTMSPAKTKVRIYKDSKEPGAKFIDVQLSQYKPKTSEGGEFYFADDSETKIETENDWIKDYPNIVKPVFYKKEPETIDGYTNLVVKEQTKVTLNSLSSGTTIKYSRDGGNTWNDFQLLVGVDFYPDEVVLLKGNNNATHWRNNFTQICIKGGKVELKGTIKSLLNNADKLSNYSACNLFKSSNGLISVDENYIPYQDQEIPAYSLYGMFSGCTNLKNALKLNGSKFNSFSCQSMYDGCTYLEKIPAMKITHVNEGSFKYMFKGCKNLVDASAIDINISESRSAYYSFNNMFNGCQQLKKPCNVNATISKNWTYESFNHIFNGCKSLYVTNIEGEGNIPFFKCSGGRRKTEGDWAFINTGTEINSAGDGIQYYYYIVE